MTTYRPSWAEEEDPRYARPPVIPYDQWYRDEYYSIRQNQHILFAGPTQSGKTLLCRQVARLHDYVVVFGTKPVDESLDAYVEEGYERIDHWPPTRRDIRKQQEKWGNRENREPRYMRFILWPKIRKREDLFKHRETYAKAIDNIFIEGGWCVVMDEGLWLADKNALNLGPYMSQMAFGAASNKVSMFLLVQRPANVPRITWSSCAQALLFHMGITDDITELSSLGTYNRQAVKDALASLGQHEFLDLPCRGGAEWSISCVDMNSPYVTNVATPADD